MALNRENTFIPGIIKDLLPWDGEGEARQMSDWSGGLCWLPGCDEEGFLFHKPDSTLPREMALA